MAAVDTQSLGVLAQTYVRRVRQGESKEEKGNRTNWRRSDKGLEFPARFHQSNDLNCRPSEDRSVSLSLVDDQ